MSLALRISKTNDRLTTNDFDLSQLAFTFAKRTPVVKATQIEMMHTHTSRLAFIVCSLVLASPFGVAQELCGVQEAVCRAPIPASYSPGTMEPVPVIFHVVVSSDSYSIPLDRIQRQITVLNSEYQQSGITFFIQSISKIVDPDNATNFKTPNFVDYMKLYNVFPNEYSNYFLPQLSNPNGAVLYIPEVLNSDDVVGKNIDGIFMNQGALTLATGDPGLRDTGVHEFGHYFGLDHTFVTSCLGCDNDAVSDTPIHRNQDQNKCPTDDPDSCPEPGIDPIRNFMNYTSAECRNEFTDGQISRIQYFREIKRPLLGSRSQTSIFFDSYSAPTTLNNISISGQDIIILPGSDVTISGSITLNNGARMYISSGASLSNIGDIILSNGSTLEIRQHPTQVVINGNISVSGGSSFSIGFDDFDPVEPTDPGLLSGTPSSSSTSGNIEVKSLGNLLVSGENSSFFVGKSGVFTLSPGRSATFENGGVFRTQGTVQLDRNATFVVEPTAGEPDFFPQVASSSFRLGKDAKLAFRNGGYTIAGNSDIGRPLVIERLLELVSNSVG
ncbi:MAG: M43 family zinc metalloprotease [Bacteroidota bacterium]